MSIHEHLIISLSFSPASLYILRLDCEMYLTSDLGDVPYWMDAVGIFITPSIVLRLALPSLTLFLSLHPSLPHLYILIIHSCWLRIEASTCSPCTWVTSIYISSLLRKSYLITLSGIHSPFPFTTCLLLFSLIFICFLSFFFLLCRDGMINLLAQCWLT